jgi:hypothetical protein
MAFGFRGPRSLKELLDMEDAARAARAAGREDIAWRIEDALRDANRASDFDAPGLAISRILRGMQSERIPESPALDLNGLDVPAAPGRLDDMDAATLAAINKSNNSYNALASGRTLRLKNNNTDLKRIRRDDILTAAQDAIRRQQEAADAEALMRKAAGAGALSLGAMAAHTIAGAGLRKHPSIAEHTQTDLEMPDEPMTEEVPTSLPDVQLPDVALLPVEDPAVVDDFLYRKHYVPEEPADLFADSPMDTADLVEESRPIPASTPKVAVKETKVAASPVGKLTPQEIAALRSQVVSIRDAKTGQAMDSFYPPESEEYKAEQRAKMRYPQLRYR